jgi:glycosyltransferase involved in cell wall biosynthesis
MKYTENTLISIIVPIYKQEKTIVEDLQNISKIMSGTRWRYEIIGVVDGFLDRSFELASKIKDRNIKIFGYEVNMGKGYAVRYGMSKSEGDLVAFIDAGMDINPNGISLILEHMQWYDADIIVGSKRHSASKVNYPFFRKVYSFIYQVLIRILFNLKVRDTQVGLKIFKRNVLEKVLPRLLVKQFAFDIEMLAVANYLGYTKIFDAPVDINLEHLGNSSFSPVKLILNKNIWSMIWDTFAVFYRLRIMKYYDDSSKRLWIYDKNLEMRVNTGELK